MVDKIKNRYGDCMVFLYMDIQFYCKNLCVKDISSSLSKLAILNDPCLKRRSNNKGWESSELSGEFLSGILMNGIS